MCFPKYYITFPDAVKFYSIYYNFFWYSGCFCQRKEIWEKLQSKLLYIEDFNCFPFILKDPFVVFLNGNELNVKLLEAWLSAAILRQSICHLGRTCDCILSFYVVWILYEIFIDRLSMMNKELGVVWMLWNLIYMNLYATLGLLIFSNPWREGWFGS